MRIIRTALVLALTATAAFACSSVYLIWIPRSKSADPLYRFIKDGLAGYIDRSGRVVFPPQLLVNGNGGGEFHDGLLEVGLSNGRYMDLTGKVIDKGFYRGWDFSEGLAVAMRKDEGLWGYIGTSGEFVISPRFATSPNGYVRSFSEGLATIEVMGKIGYIDRFGEFVIKPEFLDGSDFNDGMARVVTEGPCSYFPDGPCGLWNTRFVGGEGGRSRSCKFTYIDKTGRVITPARFDRARDFSEGLAPVQIGELWGFIDKTGAIAIAPQFADAEPFSSGLARIQVHGLYGFIDKSGAIKIAPKFKGAESFSDGFAVVGDGGEKVWYIDRKGRRTIGGKYYVASPFFKGLAHVQLHETDASEGRASFAYIDTKGNRVFEY